MTTVYFDFQALHDGMLDEETKQKILGMFDIPGIVQIFAEIVELSLQKTRENEPA